MKQKPKRPMPRSRTTGIYRVYRTIERMDLRVAILAARQGLNLRRLAKCLGITEATLGRQLRQVTISENSWLRLCAGLGIAPDDPAWDTPLPVAPKLDPTVLLRRAEETAKKATPRKKTRLSFFGLTK